VSQLAVLWVSHAEDTGCTEHRRWIESGKYSYSGFHKEDRRDCILDACEWSPSGIWLEEDWREGAV
jgi:hypothetical protein